MTLAVQYVRASTGSQSCSLEQQQVANAAFAAMRGMTITNTYSDAAISGLTLKARPALQQLLADALSPARSFDAILVYDVSRWGRFQDIDQGAHYEFLCRQAGVAVHYCADLFENDGSPEANLIKQVKRAMAAEYSRALSTRLRHAKRHIASRGFTVSGPPFGLERQIITEGGERLGVLRKGETRVARGLRTIFTPGPPEAAACVAKIFRLYVVGGLSLEAIGDLLNAEGAPSPTDCGWTVERVRRALRQEAYAGVYIYGRTRGQLGARSVRAPRDEWRRIEGAIDPIVPSWMFAKAQELLQARARRWSDKELLDDLRWLLKTRGRIDTGLIGYMPGLASPATYYKRFGSLQEAYRRIGYKPGKARR